MSRPDDDRADGATDLGQGSSAGRTRPTLGSVREAGGRLRPAPEDSVGVRVLTWVLAPFVATYLGLRWLLGELGHGLRLLGRLVSRAFRNLGAISEAA